MTSHVAFDPAAFQKDIGNKSCTVFEQVKFSLLCAMDEEDG